MNTKNRLDEILKFLMAYILAFFFILYGAAKMTGFQLNGIAPKYLDFKLRDMSTTLLAWYLFSSSLLFKIVIGCLQVISSILLIIPKTRIIGALFYLPLVSSIVLINLAFNIPAFTLSAGLFLINVVLLVLYRDHLKNAIKTIVVKRK